MIKFSSILIGTKNLEKARGFYENLLGVKFAEFRAPFASFEFDGIEFNVEEDDDYRKPNWADMYIGGRKPFSFEVTDLDEFLKNAELLGAKVIQSPENKPWGWKEAVLADLDDNEFIVEQRVND